MTRVCVGGSQGGHVALSFAPATQQMPHVMEDWAGLPDGQIVPPLVITSNNLLAALEQTPEADFQELSAAWWWESDTRLEIT